MPNLSGTRLFRTICRGMVSTSAFASLPLMLECGFESRWGLKFSGFSMWNFFKLVVRDFLRVLRFPPLLHRLMVSANKMKSK